MNTSSRLFAGLLSSMVLLGLVGADEKKDDKAKPIEIGKNVYFVKDGDTRRVMVYATVCMREGQLEQLLTRKGAKEHEAILAADIDAKHLHAALLLAGAKAGSPVKWEPKYQAANGSKIKITLEYDEKGKKESVLAQKWIRDGKKKDLAHDWVFGGSKFVPNRLAPKDPEYFLANDGDIVCVSNFESALLDLPIESPKDNADLVFEANTDRIPAKDTKVTMIFEVIPEPKK